MSPPGRPKGEYRSAQHAGPVKGQAATPAVPRRALILLAILTLVWGTNWPLFHYAVLEVSVWTFRAIAVFGAGIVLLAVAKARGQSLAIPRRWWPTICIATFFYLVLWTEAKICSHR